MAQPRPAAAFLPLTHLTYYLLLVLTDGPAHGLALVDRIRARSGDLVNPGTGSFYSIVQKTVGQGLIAEEPAESGGRKRAYQLTPLGRRVLAAEAARLAALTGETRKALARPARQPSRS